MKAGVMSAGLWGIGEVEKAAEIRVPRIRALRPQLTWDRERFAQEQIRGLVRQVFTLQRPRPVRQIVFSAIEMRTDVRSICVCVGEALAPEVRGSVAVIGRRPRIEKGQEKDFQAGPLRKNASALGSNLWLLAAKEDGGERESVSSLHTYLGEIRKEFEYSIVEAQPAGESNEALEMAQFADGIVVVVSALHTRRVTARKVIERLHEARARILGIVLSDREFPMPDRLYHWL